jgi:hypothetical protein
MNDWQIIHSYSRAQAIADGVLVAVPADIARQAGFIVPVALTRAVWDDCVAWTDADTDATGAPQDETGRLWDVLWMSSHAARRSAGRCRVRLVRIPRDFRPDDENLEPEPQLVELVMAVGPGDCGEPVITIMQPGED